MANLKSSNDSIISSEQEVLAEIESFSALTSRFRTRAMLTHHYTEKLLVITLNEIELALKQQKWKSPK